MQTSNPDDLAAEAAKRKAIRRALPDITDEMLPPITPTGEIDADAPDAASRLARAKLKAPDPDKGAGKPKDLSKGQKPKAKSQKDEELSPELERNKADIARARAKLRALVKASPPSALPSPAALPPPTMRPQPAFRPRPVNDHPPIEQQQPPAQPPQQVLPPQAVVPQHVVIQQPAVLPQQVIVPQQAMVPQQVIVPQQAMVPQQVVLQQPAMLQPAAAVMPQPEPEPKAEPDMLQGITVLVAIGLAVIAAYFSVTGMTRIFPGAEMPVIIMASVMEAGKLTGAAWLSRHWTAMGFGVRAMMSLLVATLACINAIGVFGQLSAAHLNPSVSAITAVETQAANQTARIEAQQQLIADLSLRITQIDAAIEAATKRGRSTSAMDLAQDQRRNRADLVQQRSKEEDRLVDMRTTQARIAGEQQKAAADVGVLQYAASLFGVDREQMIQILILAMVLSCDPLSITLVVATSNRKNMKARR
jgi:hypothetical protein